MYYELITVLELIRVCELITVRFLWVLITSLYRLLV